MRTASNTIASFHGTYDGGVAEIDIDGTPVWAADVAGLSDVGMAVTDDAVYVAFYSTPITQTYGDVTFSSWGGCFPGDESTCDYLMAKIDAVTGADKWVLQSGGP